MCCTSGRVAAQGFLTPCPFTPGVRGHLGCSWSRCLDAVDPDCGWPLVFSRRPSVRPLLVVGKVRVQQFPVLIVLSDALRPRQRIGLIGGRPAVARPLACSCHLTMRLRDDIKNPRHVTQHRSDRGSCGWPCFDDVESCPHYTAVYLRFKGKPTRRSHDGQAKGSHCIVASRDS